MQNRITSLVSKPPRSQNSFSAKLKARCAAVGIHHQKQLAQLVGTSQATVCRWFAGRSVPDMKQAVAVAAVLGCTVEWLADPAQNQMPRRPSTESEQDLFWVVEQIGGIERAFRVLTRAAYEERRFLEADVEECQPAMA